MSTTIDERVVEMRFDNKHFESGVSTTLSTLDRLKAALGFKGATKGFEEISAAANKVDLSGIGKSADTVGLQFNAMFTIADQALRNITNSAMQAGKNIASALTIDPIKTGLSEYETKINAIQVIKANTRSKYDTEEAQMADIEKKLSELNDYADRTIYNYTQMTNNLGKFVNQGLDLDEATNAVMGLANLAGASGASAEDMARATYQMSQAMGSVIRMQDWRSLMTANMAGEELKKVLSDFARVEGYDIDSMIAEKGTFEKTLEEGWLSGDLFTKAMNVYSDAYSEAELKAMGFADDQIKNFKALAATAKEATTEVKTASQLWDVLKETAQSGWTQTWEIIIGDFDTAKKMFTSLQVYLSDIINNWSKARNWVLETTLNFTKPWETLKEKLSGVTGVIDKVADSVDKVKAATKSLEEFQKIVSEVWRGNYNNRGDNPDRKDLLEAAGWNYDVVQDLVNKTQANKSGKSLTIDDVEDSYKKFGLTMDKSAEETEKMILALEDLTDEQLKAAGLTEKEIELYRALADEAKRTGRSVEDLGDEMAEFDGRTMLIDSFKNIGKAILDTIQIIKDAFADVFNPPNASELVIKLYNMIKAFNEFSEKLKLTTTVTNDAGEEVTILNATGKKFLRIFKGIMAVLDVVATIVGGVFRIGFKIASQVLDYFGMSILDAAAWVGDLLVKFHDWFESLIDVTGILEVVVPWIQAAAEAVSEWYDSFKSSKGIQDATKYIQDLGTSIKDWWTSLKDAEDLPKTIAEGIFNFFSNIPSIISTVYSNIKSAFTGGFPAFDQTPFGTFLAKLQNGLSIAGETIKEFGKLVLGKFNEFLSARGMEPITEDIIAGFVNGLKENAKKVYDQIVTFAKNIIAKAKEVLGIHSPSTVFFAIGGFIIAGLLGGLSAAFPQVREFFGNMFGRIGETFKDFDLSKLFAVLVSGGIVVGLKKLSDTLGAFTSVIGGTGDVLSGVGTVLTKSARSISKVIKASAKVVNNFAKSIKKIGSAIAGNIKAKSFAIRADAIMTIAKAVLMLVAALWLLSTIPTGDLVKAGIALGVVVAAIVVLIKTLDKTKKTSLDTAAFTALVMGLAGALVVLAIAMRILAGMSWDQFKVAAASVGVLGAFIAGLIAITKYGGGPKKMAEVVAMLSVLGKCILYMAIAMRLLGTMDWTQFGIASLSVGVLGVLVAGLIWATKLAGGPQKMAQVTLMISNLGKCILLMAVAMRLLGTMSWDQFGVAAASVGVLGVIVAGLVWATKLAGGPQRMAQSAAMISVLGTCILYMAIAMRLLGTMDWNQFGVAAASVGVLGVLVAGLIWATKLAGGPTGMKNTTAMLSVLGKCILLMAVGMRLLGTMSWDQFGVAAASMVVLGGFIVGLIAATKLCGGGRQLKATGAMLLQLSACIAILAVAMRILGGMDLTEFLIASGAMIILGGIITGLIAATKLAGGGKQLKQTGVTLLLISAAIAILAGVAVVLGLINLPDLAKGVGAVVILSGMMALLIAVTKNAKKCQKELIVLTAAIALMAGAVALLSMIDGKKLAVATGCLAGVMGMFALMILASKQTGKAWQSLIVMTVAIGMMAGMLYLLAQLPVEQTQGSAVALSATMLALSAAMKIITSATKGLNLKTAGSGLLMLAGVIVAAYFVVDVLKRMDGMQNGQENAIILGALMIALSAAAVIIAAAGSIISTTGPWAIAGLLMLAGVVAAAYFVVDVLKRMNDLQSGQENAILLGALMIALSAAAVIIAAAGVIIAATGGLALLGLVSLAGIIVALDAVVDVLTRMETLQNAEANLNLLTNLMTKLTKMMVVLAIVGPLAIIGVAALTALTGLMTAMGIFAVAIGALMTKFPQLEEFLNKGLPVLEQLAGSLGTMIGKFVAGFATAVTAALPEIGLSLSQFMMNAMPFIMGAKLVDESVLAGVGILAASVIALTAADLIEGIGSFLGGGTSFASLGTELSQFMTNALEFITGAKLIDPTAMEGVKTLAEALMIITAADLVEGLTSWLTGGSSLGDFGKQLTPFGEGIKGFSDAVKGIDNESVKVAAEAGKTLAEMANEIPNSGGWLGKIFGDNDADAFGNQMASFGESLAKFSGAVDEGAVDKEAVTAAVESAKALIEMSKEIPNSGGWLGKIMGENDADTFGSQMEAFGSSLATFSGYVDDGGVNVEAVTNACDAASKLVEFSKTIPNSGGLLEGIIGNNSAAAFGAKMTTFGSSLAEFSTSIAGGIDLDAVDAFATAFTKLGASGIDKLVEAFTTGAPAVDAAVLNLIQHTIEKIQVSTPSLQEAMSAAINSSVTQIRTGYVGFYSAGDYLVQGFTNGISANTFKPVAKARAMALAALEAAKEALGINSPSKEFYEVGYYTIKGFVNAIGDNAGSAEKATVTMADKLKSSFHTAMDKVNNLLSTDLDAQPTIRPILDLSDVSAGARSIGSMFNSPTLAMANIGAISTISAQRQNGVGNSDVVSEIAKLRKDIGSMNNTTYQINGITYDDGSNITDAVATLVRAARIERRV